MRDIKFRAWHSESKEYCEGSTSNMFAWLEEGQDVALEQYTGLKDKNGNGLIEVWEGDIISKDGELIGNIHENNKRETDIVIPQLGTKDWEPAYKEAVDRGFDYSE